MEANGKIYRLKCQTVARVMLLFCCELHYLRLSKNKMQKKLTPYQLSLRLLVNTGSICKIL